MYWYPYASGS
nr:Chain P, 10-mer Peptide [synthetic construct]1JUI_Q Chain Q, 10-mer Peptide [synthetic construct]1JUI_R Chain R, 10-mer Peptide [synthetic construct]1JUI_S Chain S, 10-mer Peptide [synthetic construct]